MSNTVILGAGIIGLSTAYYLSESPNTRAQDIHIVDPIEEIFHCASGYAGGFVAKDWFSPAITPLGALSYKLHKDLATAHNGREEWGYSRSTGSSLTEVEKGSDDQVNAGAADDWLREGTSRANARSHEFSSEDDATDLPRWLTRSAGNTLDVITEDDSVAQVDPKRLCQFLLKECLARGVQLHNPAQTDNISLDVRDCLASVRVTTSKDGMESDIPCSRLIITAGAWTPRVLQRLFPESTADLKVSSLAGHSLVVRSPRYNASLEKKGGCHAVFATDREGNYSPEIFSRVGGEIYIAGVNSSSLPLPEKATDAEVREEDIATLKRTAARLLGIPGEEDDLVVEREGLCFRPVTTKGVPVVGRISDVSLGVKTRPGAEGGVFVAAGHGAWGISQSLGTGLVMAEMIEGKETSADVAALAP